MTHSVAEAGAEVAKPVTSVSAENKITVRVRILQTWEMLQPLQLRQEFCV